jgi:hypothetical protein
MRMDILLIHKKKGGYSIECLSIKDISRKNEFKISNDLRDNKK